MTLEIGEPGTFWQGPIPLMLGVVGEVVYLFPFALLLVWIAEPLAGGTIGKRILGLRVRLRDGGAASAANRWRRSAIETIGLWGWTLALLAGSWQIAVAASAAGLIVFAGCFAALSPACLTLHDRLSGTSVRRARANRF